MFDLFLGKPVLSSTIFADRQTVRMKSRRIYTSVLLILLFPVIIIADEGIEADDKKKSLISVSNFFLTYFSVRIQRIRVERKTKSKKWLDKNIPIGIFQRVAILSHQNILFRGRISCSNKLFFTDWFFIPYFVLYTHALVGFFSNMTSVIYESNDVYHAFFLL